jgi:hypothetical protein
MPDSSSISCSTTETSEQPEWNKMDRNKIKIALFSMDISETFSNR